MPSPETWRGAGPRRRAWVRAFSIFEEDLVAIPSFVLSARFQQIRPGRSYHEPAKRGQVPKDRFEPVWARNRLSAADARSARRLAEGAGIGACELARRGEARGKRDVEHRQRRLAQKLARPLKSQPAIVPVDAVADVAAKQPLELSQRNSRPARQRGARERRLDARLHRAQDRQQLLVGDAEPVAEIHALRAEALADMSV